MHTNQCPDAIRNVRAIIFMKKPPKGGRPLRLKNTDIIDVLERGCFEANRANRLAEIARMGWK